MITETFKILVPRADAKRVFGDNSPRVSGVPDYIVAIAATPLGDGFYRLTGITRYGADVLNTGDEEDEIILSGENLKKVKLFVVQGNKNFTNNTN